MNLSILSEDATDIDQNPKYISVKEFETLVQTKPFDEVLENVMRAYSLGDDSVWPEQTAQSTKQSSQADQFQIDEEYYSLPPQKHQKKLQKKTSIVVGVMPS